MNSKYKSLIDNQTWDLVNLPPNKSLISTKWIFKRKFNYDGSLSRFEAGSVARDFFQQEGLDYVDTFSPVIKITLLRLILSLATLYDYHIHQMDIIIAFLNTKLQEELYILQLEGYI